MFTEIADRIVDTNSDALSILSHFSMSIGRAHARPSMATTNGLLPARSVATSGLLSIPSMSGLHISGGGDWGASPMDGGDAGPGVTSILGLFSGWPSSSVIPAGRSQPSTFGENPRGESSITMVAGDRGQG